VRQIQAMSFAFISCAQRTLRWLKIWLFGNCRENETGFNTLPNVFNDLTGQAEVFAADSTVIPKEPLKFLFAGSLSFNDNYPNLCV
jgi:hypothetical protein